MSDDAVELKGVEMFSEGSWNGIDFSSADLDDIVASFGALKLSGRVPLKLGHEGPDGRKVDKAKNPLAQLAFGWVTKVYREGKKVLADWEVPPEVASMIKKGYLRHVSVELLKDVQAGTRVIPWVLDAVALLGSDQPAVGILESLRKTLKMASDAVTLPYATRCEFSSSSRADSINFNHIGETHKMSDGTKELAEQIAELRLKLAKSDERNDALTTTVKELQGVKSAFSALKDEVKDRELKSHRKAITDRLESLVKSDDIQPKVREMFTRIFGVEDDDQVMKITLDDVDAYAKANPNPFKKQKASTIVSLSRSSDDVPPGTSVDSEMAMRVEASFREDGISNPTDLDWQRAVVRLFRSNPDLGARHRTAVNVAIVHPSAVRQ